MRIGGIWEIYDTDLYRIQPTFIFTKELILIYIDLAGMSDIGFCIVPNENLILRLIRVFYILFRPGFIATYPGTGTQDNVNLVIPPWHRLTNATILFSRAD